jgi:putative glycerol-1-phosphate prenyltransferase
MNSAVYDKLLTVRREKGGGFLLLIDPDRIPERQYLSTAEAADECGVDAILVGTSFMLNGLFGPAVGEIKKRTSLPVIIFPGSFAQITPAADAILFSSLISGRNPNYLIEEQIKGAPLVKQCGIEAIPTGYMLIESGSLTSVQFISGTLPIPRTKSDIACAHALAAQYLGMKLVYLEAGSGAQLPVPVDMIHHVASFVTIPVMVGGGLRTPEDVSERIAAGAAFAVVGTTIENDPRFTRLKELAHAAHPQESITV